MSKRLLLWPWQEGSIRGVRAIVAGTVVFATFGCQGSMTQHMEGGYAVKSPSLRGAKVDVEASRLEVEAYVEPFDAEGIRQEIAAGIDRALAASEQEGKPARFQVKVIENDANAVMLYFPCLVLLTLLGCPAAVEDTTVELTLEVDGKVYEEVGEGGRVAFLYSLQHPQIWNASPLAEAIYDALEKIDQKAMEAP